jgi:glycosyltransferase involved in cell wall biosynthesis
MSGVTETRSVLVVGPNKRDNGGMQQYMTNQVRCLEDRVETSSYDIGPPDQSGTFGFAVAVLLALRDAVAFPFECERPDVVHVHSAHRRSFYRAAFYVLFASLVWRTNVVLHVHGSSFDEFVETDFRPGQVVQSLVYAHADAIVVLSDYWKDVLSAKADPRKIVSIANAVDPAAYDPQYDQPVPHVSVVSYLSERKGIVEFLTAAERLVSEVDAEFRISIAGDGPQRENVERIVDRNDNMQYLGFVSEAEKADLLSESTIFALPSHAEGMPISILEAMAGGNAVLSTTVGSIPEVIGEEGGILVEPGDADALHDAATELVTSPDRVREMGERNRREIEERYDWESVSEKLLSVYDQLASR